VRPVARLARTPRSAAHDRASRAASAARDVARDAARDDVRDAVRHVVRDAVRDVVHAPRAMRRIEGPRRCARDASLLA